MSRLKFFAIVPVKTFGQAKSRLGGFITSQERAKLSELFLEDTLATLKSTPTLSKTVVVSSDRRAEEISKSYGANFLIEDRDKGVNAAVGLADIYCDKNGADCTLVIPQDLPLMDPKDIAIFCDACRYSKKCMVIAPSIRFDGTNVLLRRPSMLIKTHYDNNSYVTHIDSAIRENAKVKVILSSNLMHDIDTIQDARELLGTDSVSRSICFLRSRLKQ